jgi:hypothetical protein
MRHTARIDSTVLMHVVMEVYSQKCARKATAAILATKDSFG